MSHVYAVASAKGGVGKTTTAANLAAALAADGHRVVAVDADLGMANLATTLGIDVDGPTLHDVLAGDADVDDATYRGANELAVIPGSSMLDDYAIADPTALDRVVERLESTYDYVVLDTGAGLSHDTVLPLELADEVVLVSTDQRDALIDTNKTRELADRLGVPVAGAVIARVDPDAPDRDVVDEWLDTEVIETIPEDETVREATTVGEPLETFAPNSPTTSAYRSLAESLSDPTESAPYAAESAPVETESASVESESTGDEADSTDAVASKRQDADDETGDRDDETGDRDDRTGDRDDEPEERPAPPTDVDAETAILSGSEAESEDSGIAIDFGSDELPGIEESIGSEPAEESELGSEFEETSEEKSEETSELEAAIGDTVPSGETERDSTDETEDATEAERDTESAVAEDEGDDVETAPESESEMEPDPAEPSQSEGESEADAEDADIENTEDADGQDAEDADGQDAQEVTIEDAEDTKAAEDSETSTDSSGSGLFGRLRRLFG